MECEQWMQVVTTSSVMEEIFMKIILQKLKASLTGSKGTLITYEVDVREEGSVNPLFRHIGEKFGGIDLLIMCANSMTKGLILCDDNTRLLRETMETNIFGLCFVAREGAKLMKMRDPERKNIGHIIIVSSTVGQKVDSVVQTKPINGLYPATK